MTESTAERPSPDARFAAGLAIRKKVLGAAHVERAIESATEFSRPMQDLVTEYCWGAVWTREGLDLADRSMINLAMLAVLNRGRELAIHVRGALTNGVTRAQIQEIFLQVAIYAGVPAALEAFRTADETFAALEVEGVEVR
jgi:4-carboxymuconolactone decarboxylase